MASYCESSIPSLYCSSSRTSSTSWPQTLARKPPKRSQSSADSKLNQHTNQMPKTNILQNHTVIIIRLVAEKTEASNSMPSLFSHNSDPSLLLLATKNIKSRKNLTMANMNRSNSNIGNGKFTSDLIRTWGDQNVHLWHPHDQSQSQYQRCDQVCISIGVFTYMRDKS